MPSTTPNYGLALYNTTTDLTQTFIDFRTALAGISTTSNMYKIDTALKSLQDQITTLAATPSIIPVSATYISANYYEAIVAQITAYNTNMLIILRLNTTSSGTVTLNINSLGTKTLMKYDASGSLVNLDGRDLTQNREYTFRYDGTRWIWVSGTSADQVDVDGNAGNFLRISTGNAIEDSTYSPSSFALAAKGVTNGDSHDHVGGDGSAITESAMSLSDVTTLNAGVSKHGFLAKIPADSSKIISGLDGTWKTDNGWIPTDDSFTYDSASGILQIIRTAVERLSKYSKGQRFRMTQSQALTAYWPLDSNSNDSINSLNGTDTSVSYTTGKFSNGASLNGTSSKIVISDNSLLKPTGEFTFGCWFKTSTTGTVKTIFQSFSQNTNFAGYIFRINTSNVIEFIVGNNTGTTSGLSYTFISGKTVVTDNVFHYLTVSYRNNYIQIYLDGKLEINSYCVSPAYAATNYVRVGCKNTAGSDSDFFNGIIDDIFLINGYALDEETIKNKYLQDTAQGVSNIDILKNFIVNDVYYTGGNTYLVLHGGTDFSVINTTISTPYYSRTKCPYGFNLNPDKWSISIYDFFNYSKTSPVATSWYNSMDTGNLPSMVIPLGVWDVSYELFCYATSGAASTAVNIFATLSRSAASETIPLFTGIAGVGGASGVIIVNAQFSKRNIVVAETALTLYLNIKTNTPSAANINVTGSSSPFKLIATNAYL